MQFQLHFVLPPQSLTTREQILDWCVDHTPETELSHLIDTQYFKYTLETNITEEISQSSQAHTFDTSTIKSIIERTLNVCSDTLPWNETLHIFIYPGYDTFTYDYMDGVGGMAPCKNVFQLYINPTHPNWEESLKFTIGHEYHHSQYAHFHGFETLPERIIAEGLAEHFREELFHGPHAPWAIAIEEPRVDYWVPKVMNTPDTDDAYYGVMFGSDDYPKWLGYSLGYWLVKRYREAHPEATWQELTNMSPDKLLG